jgi:hypothetical protein
VLGADRLPDDPLLPPRAERQRVMLELQRLVRGPGLAPFLRAPLVLPTERHFPDPWRGGGASVARVLRRLARYAGLDRARVKVDVASADDERPPWAVRTGSGLWLVGVAGDVFTFAVESGALGDAHGLVAAGCREVARAWRRVHGLAVRDELAEEAAIDLTTIVLGFGAITTNAAHRYRPGEQTRLGQRPSTTALGVSSPQALAYALAAQLVARAEPAARKPVFAALQTNQAGFVRAAIKALRDDAAAVRVDLGLPEPGQWPAPLDLHALLGPLPADPGDDDDTPPAAAPDDPVRGVNAGKPVFRVRRSMSLKLGRLAAVPAMLMGGLAAGPFHLGVSVPVVVAAGLGLGALGVSVGAWFRDDHCSDPRCKERLSPEMTTCPRCGGQVMGELTRADDRLAAEEALGSAPAAASPPASRE